MLQQFWLDIATGTLERRGPIPRCCARRLAAAALVPAVSPVIATASASSSCDSVAFASLLGAERRAPAPLVGQAAQLTDDSMPKGERAAMERRALRTAVVGEATPTERRSTESSPDLALRRHTHHPARPQQWLQTAASLPSQPAATRATSHLTNAARPRSVLPMQRDRSHATPAA